MNTKPILLLSCFFLCFLELGAQEIVYDGFWLHDVRKIETNEIIVPTTDENIIVKLHLWRTIHDMSILDETRADFTIDYKYKKETIGTISPYYCLLKTKSGKIIESQNGLANNINSNVPQGWWRLEWVVRLDKKHLKEFIKEPITKIRLQIGFGTRILDIEFADDTLTNYIREANNAIIKQQKVKLDKSQNPPEYNNF